MGDEFDQVEEDVEREEILEDLEAIEASSIVVYSREWTIETILTQIDAGNIDLNPQFQRRNAWNDDKRSKLLESIIMGYPIPEIVLAEDPKRKKAFIVIDGKQRLLTVAGFVNHDSFQYWTTSKLKNLRVRKDLNNFSYADLKDKKEFEDEYRGFQNGALRCTIVTNFTKNDVLYDIFYRLNSGSVPLSIQELRQVLNRGEFANFLIEITNKLQPVHQVMNLKGADKRLKDVEVLLRVMAMILSAKEYTGNLKKFLDDWMGRMTLEWVESKERIEATYAKLNAAITYLSDALGGIQCVGRKFTAGNFEKRFNRVVFELQLFFFSQLDLSTLGDSSKFKDLFCRLCEEDSAFRSSLESSTKNIERYKIRYRSFQKMLSVAYSQEISLNPF